MEWYNWIWENELKRKGGCFGGNRDNRQRQHQDKKRGF